jgi:hypothetical protein
VLGYLRFLRIGGKLFVSVPVRQFFFLDSLYDAFVVAGICEI